MTTRAILAIALATSGCAQSWLSAYRTQERLDAPATNEWQTARKANLPRPGEVYRMRGWKGPDGPRYTVLDVREGCVRYALREDSWPPGLSETGTVTVTVFRRSTISLATGR